MCDDSCLPWLAVAPTRCPLPTAHQRHQCLGIQVHNLKRCHSSSTMSKVAGHQSTAGRPQQECSLTVHAAHAWGQVSTLQQAALCGHSTSTTAVIRRRSAVKKLVLCWVLGKGAALPGLHILHLKSLVAILPTTCLTIQFMPAVCTRLC